MSAAEKLKALDEDKTFNPMHLWNALPQIVAVVEAAEELRRFVPLNGATIRAGYGKSREHFDVALAALDEALT